MLSVDSKPCACGGRACGGRVTGRVLGRSANLNVGLEPRPLGV